VIDELSSEVYRMLVLEGREMTFEALPEGVHEDAWEAESREDVDPDASILAQQLEQPDDEGGVAARHLDRLLQTAMISEKLQTRLLSIHNDARTYLEEQGANILYLALGFLHWYEAPNSTESRRAPLLLVPVEIKRNSAQERFRIAYTGEEIGANLSLREKLRVEFDISLPELGEPENLDFAHYAEEVQRAIGNAERWRVEANEITLGFFSFGKFLMYKDLDAANWPEQRRPHAHEVLSALLGEGFHAPASAYGDETHIDSVVSPAEVHQVKDADSSQILAILDVNAGRNLVLQGPPGTGKSQTITNIIAEAIGNGRKVLFVAEKMAALEVVKRRLDEVGLGEAVLELHSHKTNKRAVLEELNRTLNSGRPIAENPKDDIETLTQLRDKLNGYCDAVNAPVGHTRTSFIRALGQAQKLCGDAAREAGWSFGPMSAWTESDFRSARMSVQGLERYLAAAGAPALNPFSGSRLCDFAPSQQPGLEHALHEACAATADLGLKSTVLAGAIGLPAPAGRHDVALLCSGAGRLLAAPRLEGVDLASGDWQARCDDLGMLLSAGRELQRLHDEFDPWLMGEAWSEDLMEVRHQFANKGGKWWRVLSGDFRRARTRLQGLCRKPLSGRQGEALTLIDAVRDSRRHRAVLEEFSATAQRLFGSRWRREQSDWDTLGELRDWILTLHRDVGNGTLPAGMVGALCNSPRVDQLAEDIEEVEALLNRQSAALEALVSVLDLSPQAADSLRTALDFDAQRTVLERWLAEADRMYQMVQFNRLSEDLRGKGLGFMLESARSWTGDPGSLTEAFDFTWYNGLVEKAYAECAEIRLFDRIQHEHAIGEHKRLDRLLFEHNRARLALAHWHNLPSLNGGGELNIIHREINKRRRHLPIRSLMAQAGRAVQAVKPVFMLSPMSVATYLPPGGPNFDLVIFDEASQVKPVDAFGAILRGRQAVVVGDSRQLPPTNFFDSIFDTDEEETVERVGDMESILSLFLGKGAPERMLRWHYRSRHESLIAISNQEFYDNRLVVFPSPGASSLARGLRLRYLPDTVYERGKTRSNPSEARAVARAVMDHARTRQDLTLGVVAFSVAQRDAIERHLEVLRRQDPSCEHFFRENQSEPFFVKNLENVQGDERDVILISVGYGRTAEGTMSMSFGPLNREGGERRLNVLISRARLAMDVFSNFRADDIDLERSSARGVAALRSFLAYAENRVLQRPASTGTEAAPAFEETVVEALESHGVAVDTQVGTSGFFIDIAVKDPEQPERYLLGIECDGATYHSSRSARDRDRLRQEVLEGLGWTLHRIWSTDWYRNREGTLQRLLGAIEEAKVRSGSATQHSAQGTHTGRSRAGGTLRRDGLGRQDNPGSLPSVPYSYAELFIPPGGGDLHTLPVEQLLDAATAVVETESPVHVQEITRRITEAAGLKRAGSRIRTAVARALQLGKRRGGLEIRGDFVWKLGMVQPPVRDRSLLDSGSRKVDLIAPEEIAEALFAEVTRSFSTSREDAISGAARLMGFQRVTGQMQPQIGAQLDALLRAGRLDEVEGAIMTATVGC